MAIRDPSGRFINPGGGSPLAARQARAAARIVWFDRQVRANIKLGISARIKLAAQLIRDKVVVNISRPVRKFRSARTGRIVVDPASRSKPGEFPKADTTRLMKDIFWRMDGKLAAIVGTSLDYGLILETRMNRSFLRRTLNEERGAVTRLITRGGPSLPGQTSI